MFKRKNINKYLLPALFVVLLLVSIASGALYIRSYLVKQTVQERSTQLEDMLSQIRINLEYGLETHWNLVSAMELEAEATHYADEQALIDGINTMEKYFRTDLYDCRLMLLDTMDTALI